MWFSKKKHFLVDLLKDGIVDIHNHLLPGVDDGSPDIETTIAMIDAMKDLNIQQAYVTPHIMEDFYDLDASSIREKYEQTQLALENGSHDSFLKGYAAEYMIDGQFERLVKEDQLMTLFNKLVLTEFSYFQKPNNINQTIFDFTIKEKTPILAHPERYRYIKELEEYTDLKNRGFLFQLNLLSISGHYGTDAFKKASLLLENDLYDFIGTDAHKLSHLKELKVVTLKAKQLSFVERLITKHRENTRFIH